MDFTIGMIALAAMLGMFAYGFVRGYDKGERDGFPVIGRAVLALTVVCALIWLTHWIHALTAEPPTGWTVPTLVIIWTILVCFVALLGAGIAGCEIGLRVRTYQEEDIKRDIGKRSFD